MLSDVVVDPYMSFVSITEIWERRFLGTRNRKHNNQTYRGDLEVTQPFLMTVIVLGSISGNMIKFISGPP